MEPWGLLTDILVLLAGALLLGGVFARLGQTPLLGYLIAGMIMGGDGSVGFIRSEEAIDAIAELGVSLLLFSLGLEFSLAELKKLGAKTLVAGGFQVVITTAAASAVATVMGLGGAEAFAVGAMVSLSSTAVVLRILMERAEVDSAHGRQSLAVCLVQDVAFIPLALTLSLLGGTAGLESGAGEVVKHVGNIAVSISVLVLGLYVVLNKLAVLALGSLSLERNRELVILLAVLTGLGSAGAAHAAGISSALGAFLAGMFLGSSPFATQIRADIAPLRVVLLTLFFGAAGMVADPIWIIYNLPAVLAVTALLMVGKMIIIWAIFGVMRQTAGVAAATGICLCQIGEFAFVLGSLAMDNQVLDAERYRLVVSVAIVSLLLSPFLIGSATTIGARLARLIGVTKPQPEPPTGRDDPDPDVVIVGFGPAGRIAAEAFLQQSKVVLVVDLNREGVKLAREMGFQAQVGDATQFEVLSHARVAAARAVVITIPHRQSAMVILDNVRRLAPHAYTLVRSRYQIHTADFSTAGASDVTGDEEEVARSLGKHLKSWVKSHPDASAQAES